MSGWSSRGSRASSVGRASAFSSLVLLSCVVGAAAGCSPAVPSFPPLPVDAGIECDDANLCPSGQTCLQGICYAACDATHACGALESCSSGVCVRRVGDAGPPRDAAPSDTPVDPCIAAACASPTPICRDGLCVECQAASDCGGAFPICDLGRARCVAFDPDYCGPCNSDLDCSTAGGTSFGSCTERMEPGPVERVCLPACDASTPCPNGFRCEEPRCVPTTESCTGYFGGVRSRTCADDSECAQIGATVDTGLITGACSDDGAGPVCHYACGLPTDCPAPFTCSGGFCLP